ncbi:MAG: L,D-transpeptidase family protein [Candidatus Contendobacter sp.]|jgi:lipoprotein-anchoring transpeptidase ErfK/SrfK|nr:L,D-transpeptidase family protein [Candidatus Contendobacter sp.]
MKFRTVLVITLLLTAINGGIAIYWYLLPPPAQTVPDQSPAVTTAPEAPKPPETPPAETAPSPAVLPEKKPPRTPKPPKTLPPANSIADRILVEKKARRLTLFRNNTPIKTYDIALGQQPEGPKQFAGDNKTPEGRYRIASRKKISDFHRALRISYPGPEDVAFAAKKKRSAGGDIMIHGLPNGMGSLGRLHLLRDWTAGCIAVTNAEIEELWRTVPDGTPIEIRP